MAVYGAALKAIYGGSASEVYGNLVPVTLNWRKGDGKSAQLVVVKVNRHVMAARLRNVNDQMVAYCNAHGVGYTLHDVQCFNWRTISGSSSLSMHSGAIAIDINPSENPMKYGSLVTNIPSWMLAIFKANGFLWGGNWARHDAMHFELSAHTEPVAVEPPAHVAEPYSWVWVWGPRAKVTAWQAACNVLAQKNGAMTGHSGSRVALAHCGKRANLVIAAANKLGLAVRSVPTRDTSAMLVVRLREIAATK